MLSPSGYEFTLSVEGSGVTVAPSGAILGASGGNGVGGSAGATSSYTSPSDYACGYSTK